LISNDKIREALKHKDILGAGARKRLKLNKQENFTAIMKEFDRNTLYSGSGKKVKTKKQAIAIAYSTSGGRK